MAKQTFTTGQVLTAAQMTSLQQTAMLGGSASAKVASYTLVAADAGTAITMSNASATTITVNTSLFTAGDTVQITNIGAGVCTITAGTATVNTSASLALAQYESGTLIFISTSSAIFVKGAGASGGKNFVLLNAGGTSLSGATTSVTGISGRDQILVMVLDASTTSNARPEIRIELNGSTTLNTVAEVTVEPGSAYNVNILSSSSNTVLRIGKQGGTTDAAGGITGSAMVFGCNTAGIKTYTYSGSGSFTTGGNANQTAYVGSGIFNSTSTISSITIRTSAGTFDAGSVFVYASA